MSFVRCRHASVIVALFVAALPCGAQRAVPVAAVSPLAERSHVTSGDTVPQTHRARNAKRGAVIGGVLGAIAGAAGSTQMGVGCALPTDGTSCDVTGTRLRLALWFGSLGFVGVGALGALLGALIP